MVEESIEIFIPVDKMDKYMIRDAMMEEDSVVLPYDIITHPSNYTTNDLEVAKIEMNYLMKLVMETHYVEKEFIQLMNTRFYMTYDDEKLSEFREDVVNEMEYYRDCPEEYDQLKKIINMVDTEMISRRIRE